MHKPYVIGIDIGGTKISSAIGTMDGSILHRVTLPTCATEGAPKVLDQMMATVRTLLTQAAIPPDQVASAGIGSPGSLIPHQGIAIAASNIPYNNTCLTKPIEEHFQIPAFLDNDANVAALGEYVFGAGRNTQNMIYVTISTGIGAGAVLGGQVYRGTACNALEIGHTIIDAHSPYRCKCGNYGDAEALCSGTAIMNRSLEAIASGRPTSLRQYAHPTAAEVYLEYQKGDPVAIEILDTAFDYLGITLANITVSFDPDCIVIGGGVASIGPLLFEKAEESMRKRSFPVFFEKVRLLPAAFGKDVGVQGALALALQYVHGERPIDHP